MPLKFLKLFRSEEKIENANFSQFHILKDESLNKQLIQKGYIILPILTPEEVRSFKELYKKWHVNDNPIHFYKSYFSKNPEYRNEVENKVFEIWNDRLQEYFLPFELMGGMFVVKPQGIEGHIPPHQDFSLVDETKSWSINSWCPLEDTSEEYGILKILPGSHTYMNTVRGYGIPEHYTHLNDIIEKHFVPIHLKAGECVFFHLSIIHGSSYNQRQDPRVAIGCTILPEKVQLEYNMIADNEAKVRRYAVDKAFFKNYTHQRNSLPDSKLLIETYQPNFVKMTDKQLKKKIEQS